MGLIQIRFFRWFAESVPITIVSEKLRLVPNTPFREQGSKDLTAFQETSWSGGILSLWHLAPAALTNE